MWGILKTIGMTSWVGHVDCRRLTYHTNNSEFNSHQHRNKSKGTSPCNWRAKEEGSGI